MCVKCDRDDSEERYLELAVWSIERALQNVVMGSPKVAADQYIFASGIKHKIASRD